MSGTELDLARVDRDGAIAETRGGLSRAGFLTAAGAGALLALAPRARAAGLSKTDVDVLNYALSLEYLQAAFYTESERSKALKGRAAKAAAQVGAVERAHVQAFRALLGRKAMAKPRFDFQGVTEDPKAFLKTAVAFEDLAVEAYKGQAPRIQSERVLAAALGIHTVEARHAAWMRYLNGIQPAAAAFDDPRDKGEIDRIVRATGFVTAKPKMTTRRKPKYTG
ncbi:MAG TPA: ferritin-like domain-containing protein [Solirubrobacteraceae bacterium]|nr:ferritin-like domain-containing protein [Solirubrobacteraceae bacterium]